MSKPLGRQDLERWIEARRRFHLSHAHIQMARELGLDPMKLGKLANHRQEPWKLPLPDFIEELYHGRFGRPRPERVLPIEEHERLRRAGRATKKARKRAARDAAVQAAGGIASPSSATASRTPRGDADAAPTPDRAARSEGQPGHPPTGPDVGSGAGGGEPGIGAGESLLPGGGQPSGPWVQREMGW